MPVVDIDDNQQSQEEIEDTPDDTDGNDTDDSDGADPVVDDAGRDKEIDGADPVVDDAGSDKEIDQTKSHTNANNIPSEFMDFDPSETSDGPWPSCVDKESDLCREWIVYLTSFDSSLNEDDIHLVPQDGYVSMDYDTSRVRIFINTKTNLVARTPRRG